MRTYPRGCEWVLTPNVSCYRPGRSLRKIPRAALITLLFLGSFVLGVPQAMGQLKPTTSVESLDLPTIARIREEGLRSSHVMEYAGALTDQIGSRLTGSPEFERGARWAVQQLHSMGVADAHEESWGEFGMSWTQIRTTLLLDAPSPATLIAQATPWSPSTRGEITASVILLPFITDEAQLKSYAGKLAGKVVLYGQPPAINLSPKSPLVPIDDAYFKTRMEYPLNERAKPEGEFDERAAADRQLREKLGRFFADEGALAVLVSPIGDANTFRDEESVIAWHQFQKEHRQPIPSAIVAPDAYGRLARLTEQNIPLTIKLNIESRFGSEHVDGQNVIGEIKGADPLLGKQIVMFGAHLDSWAAATGATDDGAGAVICLEALRILSTVGVRPRRTIRLALWGGEEEGEIGSMRYLNQHFAKVERPQEGPWAELPDWDRPALHIHPAPDYENMDVYFNVDAGGGRFFGIYAANNLAAAAVFHSWIDPVRDLGFDKVSLLSRRGIDVERFQEIGLPGFQFMQDLRDYDTRTHHTNLDTYERLSEPDLKQAATIMAIFVYNAAQRDAMIPRMQSKP